MQTAYAMLDERERCVHIGCSGYITKPLEKERIIDAIYKALH